MRCVPHMLVLVLLCGFFYLTGNSSLSLTNPDEVFYAGTAREMAARHSWMTPYLFGQPQFEKPILTYWLIRIAYISFGNNAFAARFFPAVFALIGVVVLYGLATVGFRDRRKALACAVILGSAVFYLAMARTVFTDMIFSVCILCSLAAFYWGYVSGRKAVGLLLFFVTAACAVLAKGPLGLFIPSAAVLLFLALRKELPFLASRWVLVGATIFLVIALPWYVAMLKWYGSAFIREFWVNDHLRRIFEAEHVNNDRWYFYPLSMLGGLYPWTVYLGAGLAGLIVKMKRGLSSFESFILTWLAATFIVFQPAHSKLVSYILPLFPALALVAGDYFWEKVIQGRTRTGAVLSVCTSLSLIVLPAGLHLAVRRYPEYVAGGLPFFLLAVACWGTALLVGVQALKGKRMQAFYSHAAAIPVVLLLIPLATVEPYVSSRRASEILARQPGGIGTVLCSKAFVRGVQYYSGAAVAVFDTGSDSFFSPHPVPFLSTEEQLVDFLSGQPVTYCVLRKNNREDLCRFAGTQFVIEELGCAGNEYVLGVKRKQTYNQNVGR